MVLKVPDQAEINWSGRKMIPLCGVQRDTKRSNSIFESGQIIGIVIRDGTIMKNRRQNGKMDGEKIIDPLWNGTDLNCSENVYYCVNGDSEMVVCILGAEREAVVHVITALNFAAQKVAVVWEYR